MWEFTPKLNKNQHKVKYNFIDPIKLYIVTEYIVVGYGGSKLSLIKVKNNFVYPFKCPLSQNIHSNGRYLLNFRFKPLS